MYFSSEFLSKGRIKDCTSSSINGFCTGSSILQKIKTEKGKGRDGKSQKKNFRDGKKLKIDYSEKNDVYLKS